MSKSLSSLITERLAQFGQDLTIACESLAHEREKRLRDDNLSLRTQINELRYRLELQSAQSLLPKQQSAQGITQEPWQSGNFASIADVAFVKPDESDTSLNCNTEVLPTFQPLQGHANDTTMGQCVVKVNESGTKIDALLETPRASTKEEFELLPQLLRHTSEDLRLAAMGEQKLEQIDTGFAHHASLIATELRNLEEMAGKLVLDPSSIKRLSWDLMGIPILSWDLITIPLAVFELTTAVETVFHSADWVTLAYWTTDIPLTFFTGIYDDYGREIYNQRIIARNYLRRAFTLDIIIISSDWIPLFIEHLLDGDSPDMVKNVAILRMLRISRFARLLRLRKLKNKMQAFEDTFNSEWYLIVVDLVVKVLKILVINHYIACGWYMLGTETWTDPHLGLRWVDVLPYPQYDGHGGKMTEATMGYKYTTCLHWAVAQFTPGPHPIQPQNVWERVYAIGVLLFGMVIFSSFVASLTQARMQMTKMMGQHERDHWLLREFCRQHHVSLPLQKRIKRYIDLVVMPATTRLCPDDVVFIKKLSPHLRLELNTELYSAPLCVHPLFLAVRRNNTSVINDICSIAIQTMSFAHGDVAFVGGQVAHFMLFVVSGHCDYIPISDESNAGNVPEGTWVSEANFWTHWVHQGQLQASTESTAVSVDGEHFRNGVLRSATVMRRVRRYGSAFCAHLNSLVQKNAELSDLDPFATEYFGALASGESAESAISGLHHNFSANSLPDRGVG